MPNEQSKVYTRRPLAFEKLSEAQDRQLRECDSRMSHDSWPPSKETTLRTVLRLSGALSFGCFGCFSFLVILCYSCLLFFSCYSCWLFFSCFSCWLCLCYVSLLAFLFLLGQVRSGSVRLRERYVGSASCRRCGACPTGWDVRQREAEAGEVRPVQARRSARKILLLRFLIFSKGSSTLTLRKEPGPRFHLLMILEISWGWKPHKLEGNNSLCPSLWHLVSERSQCFFQEPKTTSTVVLPLPEVQRNPPQSARKKRRSEHIKD